MAQFCSLESRQIYTWTDRQSFVTGSRMVLFLINSEVFSEPNGSNGTSDIPAREIKWLPTGHPEYRPIFAGGDEPHTYFDRMRISVIWIEDGGLYAFSQMINPGPLRLSRLSWETEEEVKSRCSAAMQSASSYEKAVMVADPGKRAKALVPFISNENCDFRHIEPAYNAMGECGIYALPYLRDILQDAQYVKWHCLATKELAQAGGKWSGAELTKILRYELDFVNARLTVIKNTKWNGLPSDVRWHIINMEQAIKALKWLRFCEARQTVTDTLQYWNANRLPGSVAGSCRSYIKEHR